MSNAKKAYPGFKLMPMGNMAELTHQSGYGGFNQMQLNMMANMMQNMMQNMMANMMM